MVELAATKGVRIVAASERRVVESKRCMAAGEVGAYGTRLNTVASPMRLRCAYADLEAISRFGEYVKRAAAKTAVMREWIGAVNEGWGMSSSSTVCSSGSGAWCN